MHLSTSLIAASLAFSAQALDFGDITSLFRRASGGSGGCPAVWNDISNDLTKLFLSNGQCNDDARAAIRAAFHDCGTWNKAQGNTGGCDGSLILAPETGRPENNGLQDISAKLYARALSFNVRVADIIQFAGGNIFLLMHLLTLTHQQPTPLSHARVVLESRHTLDALTPAILPHLASCLTSMRAETPSSPSFRTKASMR